MKGIAFSVKGLLAAVTLIAVGLFALLNATSLWASIIVLLTLLLLLTALLAIVYRRGEPRSFWVGFAIFGWVYFILTHPPLGESYHSLLPTHAALETLHESVSQAGSRRTSPRGSQYFLTSPPLPNTAAASGTRETKVWDLQGGSIFFTVPPRVYFYRIGHCLWAWLLALFGGFLARHFYLAQERKPS